jgi:predicted transcriptional regulator
MCDVTERFTISLPNDIAGDVRRRAHRTNRPVSHVIADALRAQERAELQARLEQDYQDAAEESYRLAEEALPAVREVLPDD